MLEVEISAVICFSASDDGSSKSLFWLHTRIPLWSTIKLAAAAWLVLPQFRGGTIVYEQYVRPYFYSTVQNADAKLTDNQRKFLSSISPEACNSVAQFINDNGSDAFDKIMAAVS
jgi:receptor expression-enhancing protein 5/6